MSMLRMRAPLTPFGENIPLARPLILVCCLWHEMSSCSPARALAAYSVCFILVLSFICFEVLDIDGSDFAGPMRAAATIKATDPPGDLRRAPLQTAIPTQPVVVNEYGERLQVQHRVDDACAD